MLVVFRAIGNLHSQSIYKLSLAVSDLLTGILIIPSSLRIVFVFHEEKLDRYKIWVNGTTFLKGTWNTTLLSVTIPTVAPPMESSYIFQYTYSSLFGFLTTICIFTSIYSLAAASVDRYFAMSRPLQYTQSTAKRYAKRIIIAIWLIAIVVSCLPFILDASGVAVKYVTIGVLSFMGPKRTFSESKGVQLGYGEIVYVNIAILAAPVLLVWILSILTYRHTKKLLRKVQRKRFDEQLQIVMNKEGKLAVTLRIMVAGFTLCFLPAILVLFGMLSPHIYIQNAKQFSLAASDHYTNAEYICQLFIFLNGLVNFFVYNIRNKVFRSELKKLFKRH